MARRNYIVKYKNTTGKTCSMPALIMTPKEIKEKFNKKFPRYKLLSIRITPLLKNSTNEKANRRK